MARAFETRGATVAGRLDGEMAAGMSAGIEHLQIPNALTLGTSPE